MSFGDNVKMILERGSFMEKEEVRASLTELIAEEMPELDEIDMEKNIISEYGINSVSIIRLIVAAEEKYEITFSDFELSLDEYSTFGDLAMTIKTKLDEKDD